VRLQLDAQARTRYDLEPFIFDFARFPEAKDKRVLEVGVGMGADHLNWAAQRPALLAGIDLTDRAVQHTRQRLNLNCASSCLHVADAEQLPFHDESFDIVYSWGVLHHSPDTARAVSEIHRVLKPGGRAAVMVYHRNSLTGAMLWLRYGMLKGLSLNDVYARYLESPGTKAYDAEEALRLFGEFSAVQCQVQLSPGDLLVGAAGQRHNGALLSAARTLWPRALIRRVARRRGLFLLIDALK